MFSIQISALHQFGCLVVLPHRNETHLLTALDARALK